MEKKHIRKGSGWYEVEQAEKQLKSKKVLARRTTIEKPLMYSEYDLPKHEIDNLKERFLFFDRNKTGYIYRYQLPMLLKYSGYNLDEDKIKKIDSYMIEMQIETVDLKTVLLAVTYLKELELASEDFIDDEYIDAFVAMGGDYDKTGTIKKETLIGILKVEFELTIDMEDYLQTIGGEEDIDFNQFCILLDAGTAHNLERKSSFMTQRALSRCISFYGHLEERLNTESSMDD